MSTEDTDTDTTAADMTAAIAVDAAGPVRVSAPLSAPGLVAARGRTLGRGVLVTVAVGLGAAALAVLGAALGCLLTGTVLATLSRRPVRRPGAGVSASGQWAPVRARPHGG